MAKKARDMATVWLAGESAVENIAAAIRKVPGFGGKGFRMKEVVLDLAMVTQNAHIEDQLCDFGVVGPGPRCRP